MPSSVIRARPPRGEPRALRLIHDPDRIAPYLEDAAHFPGGHAPAIAAPASEAEVADAIARSRTILPVGAQSSLTGGATPMGDVVMSTARLNRIGAIGNDSVRVQAGVTLAALDAALEAEGRYYPPGPTFEGAFVGGTVATNAAGAATFKYGATRDWVQALTVVLPDGEVLDLERGATRAHHDGYFDLELTRGRVRVPVPRYRMPPVQKLSAGYFAAADMDLIDLFIGSEGTLGVVTEVTLRLVRRRPAFCRALVPFAERERGLSFVGTLRRAAIETRRTGDPHGVDVSAIEHMDERCVALLREDGVDRQYGVPLPPDTTVALLVTIELPGGVEASTAFDEIGRAFDAGGADTPLSRFVNLLADAYAMSADPAVLDRVVMALPGDRARAAQLLAVREAVPLAVNSRVGRAQRDMDALIEKTAGDLIVPFDRFGELLDCCDREFGRRGLDGAVWGHASDGNVHPNVIPRSIADVESGREAILALGRASIRLGGAPLAEHGVGRSRIKQRLLRELYGEGGIEDMRRVRRAIDPMGKLAPGVLFEL